MLVTIKNISKFNDLCDCTFYAGTKEFEKDYFARGSSFTVNIDKSVEEITLIARSVPPLCVHEITSEIFDGECEFLPSTLNRR